MKPRAASVCRVVASLLAAGGLACAPHAHAEQASEFSEASALPIAMSVALPVSVLSGTASLVVTGVEASGNSVSWIVENAVDGLRSSVRFGAHAVGGSAVAVGTVLTVTAISTGWLLSAAGRAVALIPNEIGESLLYNERVSR